MLKPPHTTALVGATGVGAVLPEHVLAYIGPGAGLGAIAVTVALLVGVLLLLVGLVWYPLKRLYRTRMGDAAGGSGTDEPG